MPPSAGRPLHGSTDRAGFNAQIGDATLVTTLPKTASSSQRPSNRIARSRASSTNGLNRIGVVISCRKPCRASDTSPVSSARHFGEATAHPSLHLAPRDWRPRSSCVTNSSVARSRATRIGTSAPTRPLPRISPVAVHGCGITSELIQAIRPRQDLMGTCGATVATHHKRSSKACADGDRPDRVHPLGSATWRRGSCTIPAT